VKDRNTPASARPSNTTSPKRGKSSLSYQVRGLSEEDANRFVDQVARDKAQLVGALARERLSTTEEGLRKPWTSAISGALSTALGALILIIPFFFLTGYPAVVVPAVVFPLGTLRCRCREISHYDPFLVVQWI
jgi:hypothetical protein